MSQHPSTDLSATPRYASAWAVLVYVLCVMTVAWPALTGGFLVSPISDQYIGGFPVRDFAAQSLKAGLGVPLWNPYIMGGMPYVAAMGVGDVFYPTQLLRVAFPVDIGMTLGFIIHVVLAGFFTYTFCRAIGLTFLASLIAGAAYMLSGPVGGLVSPGHDGKLFVAALTPLFLLVLIRGVRDGRPWAWGAIAIVTGLALLTPHPQLLQYMLLLGGFFALYLAFGEWNGVVLARRVGVTRLGFALGAIGLGFLIGAIQYSGLIEYIPWSPRAGGRGWEHAVSYSMPVEELFNAYLPQFSGMLGSYWGRNGLHFHSEYVGPAILMLATAAVGATGKGVAFTRRFKLFWLGALIVSLLWAFGGFTPFYRIIYAIVPGTKYFRAPSTIMYISMFATAIFAAIGAERVLTQGVSRRFLYVWGGVAALVAILGVAGGLNGLASSIATSIGTEMALARGAPAAPYVDYFVGKVDANAGSVVIGSVRALFFAALTLALCWGIASSKLSGFRAAIALLLVVVGDLWSVERHYWQFSARASKVYASDPTIEYLKARTDSGRVMPIILDPPSAAYRDPMLNYDGLMVHGVRQVTGSHGNELGNFDQVGGADSGWQPILERPHLWSLFNVRYLMTNVPPSDSNLTRMYGGSVLVAGPARNAAGTMVYLYRLPGDNPPAWVATTTIKAPNDASLATVQDSRFNAVTQRRVALIDTASPTPSAGNPNALPAPSAIAAQVSRPTHGRIHVDLSAPAQDGTMLIVSENFYPGWKARIDGREARTERANYTLIGVPLSTGARRIELEFTSESYKTGKLLTWLASAAALALLGIGVLAERKKGIHAEAA